LRRILLGGGEEEGSKEGKVFSFSFFFFFFLMFGDRRYSSHGIRVHLFFIFLSKEFVRQCTAEEDREVILFVWGGGKEDG